MALTLENIDNVTDIEWGDHGDYKGCDAFIETAYWRDTGLPLDDEEIEQLNMSFLYYFDEQRMNGWVGSQISLAETLKDE